MVARLADTSLPGAGPIVQHLTLWVAFLGAGLAAAEGRLLSLATADFLPDGALRRGARILAATVAAGVSLLLARAGWEMVRIEREFPTEIAYGLETWMAQLVIPVAFVVIALRLVWRADPRWGGRLFAVLGLVAGAVLGQVPEVLADRPVWPGLVVVAVATALGAPLFAALGGAAVLLFMADAVPMAAVPVETYRLAVHPTLAAIPIFTVVGFLLAESRASERLVEVFRALFGWIPGGTAVVTALVCAFFTVFTGGSGVTILALGALLLQALRTERYRERFSIGLLTASGSLGLLLPPALPLILYGIVAQVPIEQLFLGGLLPGLLLVGLVAAWGVREGVKTGVPRIPFAPRRALGAIWQAKWELLLPGVVLGAILSPWATPVEAASLGALWALLVVTVFHRDLRPREVPRVLRDCAVLVGGVLIILAVAMGLTSWLVDAQVPAQVLAWVEAHVESKIVFLIGLNLFLLAVGCLMDIFSATVVVVPLIVPLGLAFDIHPIHLGILFIANLELGYLTPPVGLNLFLASYRFEKPLLEVYRAALPMLVILGIGVALITFVPALTTALLPAP